MHAASARVHPVPTLPAAVPNSRRAIFSHQLAKPYSTLEPYGRGRKQSLRCGRATSPEPYARPSCLSVTPITTLDAKNRSESFTRKSPFSRCVHPRAAVPFVYLCVLCGELPLGLTEVMKADASATVEERNFSAASRPAGTFDSSPARSAPGTAEISNRAP